MAEALKKHMQNLASDVLLPNEKQLAKQFDVSRATLRRALDLLEQEGLVDRRQGRGTVVSSPRVSRALFPTIPIEQDFRQQGLSLETELLHIECQAPTEEVKHLFGWPDERPVVVIPMIRRVAGRIICFDQRHVSEDVAKHLEFSKIGEVPVATLIAQCARRPVVHHDWNLAFNPSSPEIAKILGVTPGTLIVVSSGVDYLDDQTPLCVTIVSHRIDRINFRCSAPYNPNAFSFIHEDKPDE